MSVARHSATQVAFELRTFRRNRSAMAFTFFFPVMFLVLFGIGGNDRTTEFKGNEIPFLQFFIPGILAYGLIGACYNNLAMRIVMLRDMGVLKRVRGTPLQPLAYVGGQIGASVVIGVVISVLTLLTGVLIYGITFYPHTAAALLVTLVIGAAAFCAIGLAMASMIPNADGAPAIINVTILPIIFISDIFYSIADAPKWLNIIAGIFPIKHLANALQVTFDPNTTGAGFSPGHLLVITIWGAVAAVYALRNFRWENRNQA